MQDTCWLCEFSFAALHLFRLVSDFFFFLCQISSSNTVDFKLLFWQDDCLYASSKTRKNLILRRHKLVVKFFEMWKMDVHGFYVNFYKNESWTNVYSVLEASAALPHWLHPFVFFIFQIYPDPELEQQILALAIRCIHSEEGCRWTGQMKQLQVRKHVLLQNLPRRRLLTRLGVSLRATSPPAPSTWSRAPTAAPSSWRAATCPTTCSTTAPSARSSASSAAASLPEKPTR